MNGFTRRQARILRRQIAKLYRRNYIPLLTSDSTLSIGDILHSKHDLIPIIDSSVFSKESTASIDGAKTNLNITSGSEVNLSFKLKGENILTQYFNLEDAGLLVEFTSKDQMFLKVQGLRQVSLTNFIAFQKEFLEKYCKGEISSKAYIVRGLVVADTFYLQYSGSNGGTIGLNLDAKVEIVKADINADFSLKWKKDVGYSIDGSNGGVLAYRVSGVRLNRNSLPEDIHEKILNGTSESDVLASLPIDYRKDLLKKNALEISDLTDEIIIAHDEEIV
jgi:hypothetical protein